VSPPLVSLIAVNFNGAHLLDRFLAGVAGIDYEPLEVIVVDNASTDGSPAALERLEGVHAVLSSENLGFGRGCNLGARHARGELLLFLNPDVDLEPDTVRILVRDLLQTDGAAISCARLSGQDLPPDRSGRVHDVASMSGAVMLVERAHFDSLGGFDPSIFLYYEDTDLCYRTVLAGRRVLKSWDATASHAQGGTGGGIAWSAEQVKNGLYVHLKTRSWPATLRFSGRMAAKSAVRGIRMRDTRVLTAWTANLRDLRATLAKRRSVLSAASRYDRERLELLGTEHAYWARREWREGALHSARDRLGRRGA
jgi:GT2 family glycosyltransferase